ncbi:MAG: YfiR family protein [Epsilonproteobacteria bacterium]|nr:YfiR family protein [Campylobacterota bacterium]
MKFLLIISILFSTIFAININESLLSIHATLVPKIPLMDYKFREKLDNDAIKIIIYHDRATYKSAKLLKKKIDKKYKDGINKHKIETKLISYNKKQSLKANIYYLLPSTKSNIKKALHYAKENNAITFSYSKSTLSDGCMISLNIGKRVKPIINLEAIKSGKISLRPVLLDISDTCNCGTI